MATTTPPAHHKTNTPSCGASSGTSPTHLAAARSLAHALHAANATLVYGGGTVGLMGEIARTLVSLSGPDAVHGIIPSPLVAFERENGVSAKPADSETKPANETASKDHNIDPSIYGRTTIVPDMHTRKRLMAEQVIGGGAGGGFVALSGGYGTFEELLEITTWNQLGIHDMPVIVYNVDGYWDGLLEWVRNAVESGFVGEANRGIIRDARSAEEVVERLRDYENAPGRFKLSWGDD